MSYEENDQRKRSGRGFRTTLDLGMGLFYVVIGLMVVIFKSFFEFKIPAVLAYVLGVMMIVGGGFRFYKGLKDILPNKKGS